MNLDRHRDVLAPAAMLFAILAAHALLETARDALFLARLGPQRLAWAYLAIAATALVAVTIVRGWGRVREPRQMLVAFLAVAAIGTAALAATVSLAPWLVFALYVWTGLVATLVVPAFWTLVDARLRIGEAKRAFAAIGAGGALGALVGSAGAAVLSRFFAARHLVTAGAIAFALATITAIVLAPDSTNEPTSPRRARVDPRTASMRSRRYVHLLIVVGLASTVTLTLGDLTFKRVLAERLPAADLATVFGTIYTGLSVISLVIQLAVTPRILAWRGVGDAMMVLPLLVGASALGFAVTGAAVAIVALKLGDGGLRHSLHRVASEILFVPVPSAMRDAYKPVADAIGQRGGQALAAMLVFAAAAVGSGAQGIGAITAAAGAAWLVAIWITRRAYVEQFRDALKAGEIHRDGRVPDLDGDAVNLLIESLSSPDEIEALAALDLLARGGGRVPTLVLYHPHGSVVRRALSFLEGDLRPEVVRVLGHLHQHDDPLIRSSALAASSRTGFLRDRLVPALADRDPEVRAVALVGLVDDPDRGPAATAGITALVDGSTTDRIALARAIGHAPGERFRRVVYDLLATREQPVMREILRVLARVPSLAELDRLLGLLEDPHIRGDVRRVFTAVGRRGLDFLIEAIDDPRTPLGVRRHLPRTISQFRSLVACTALVARLPREPDGTTEFKILRALGRMRADDPTLAIDPAILRAYALRAVADAARYTTLSDRLEGEPPGLPSSGAELLRELLAEKRRYGIEHAFRALGILHPRADLRSVHDAIVGSDDQRRGAAREIVEGLVPIELRVSLLAVIDDLPADQRRARLGNLAAGPFAKYEDFVAVLLADPSESLRCVAAHHAAACRLVALRAQLVRLRPVTGLPLVIQAFDHAIARLGA